jgi:two-component system response regulator FixJ
MSGVGVVHVIDDDPAVRDSLSLLLAAVGHTVNAYPSAQAFLDRLPATGPGCVVTDVQMPEITGIELLEMMQDRLGELPVIVLTGRADVPLAVRALKAGAADFIEKPYEPETIIGAVRAVLQRVARAAERGDRQTAYADRIAALSARERDVLRGLVAGESNKSIARALAISPRTVETYRANIMMKTQAASFSELVRMALLAGEPG